MTRRIIAYRTASSYLFSQEFNGDREEAIHFNPSTPIKANWTDVIALFDGVESPLKFLESVRAAEKLFTYEALPLSISADLPSAEEIWLLKNGALTLHSKYGELIQGGDK